MEKPVVFYIDDEIDNITIVKAILSNDFQVYGFNKASEALDEMSRHKPLVVMSDLDMPKMNGIDFLTEVKRVYPAAQRIMITGKSTEQSAIDAINKAGISEYIKKPFKNNELVQILSKACEKVKKREQEKLKHQKEVSDLLATLSDSQKHLLLGALAGSLLDSLSDPLHLVDNGVKLALKSVVKMPDSSLSQDAIKMLMIAQKSASLAVGVFKHLKDFSSEGSGEIEDVNLENLFSTINELVANQASDRGVTVLPVFESNLVVTANRAGLYMLIMNLVLNAIEASNQGSGKIWVEADRNQSQWTLRIKDNGAGMSEDTYNKMFDPFFTTKEGRAGLGLLIVKNEVHRHQGKMEVKSIQGEGTVFKFEFPVISADVRRFDA